MEFLALMLLTPLILTPLILTPLRHAVVAAAPALVVVNMPVVVCGNEEVFRQQPAQVPEACE